MKKKRFCFLFFALVIDLFFILIFFKLKIKIKNFKRLKLNVTISPSWINCQIKFITKGFLLLKIKMKYEDMNINVSQNEYKISISNQNIDPKVINEAFSNTCWIYCFSILCFLFIFLLLILGFTSKFIHLKNFHSSLNFDNKIIVHIWWLGFYSLFSIIPSFYIIYLLYWNEHRIKIPLARVIKFFGLLIKLLFSY